MKLIRPALPGTVRVREVRPHAEEAAGPMLCVFLPVVECGAYTLHVMHRCCNSIENSRSATSNPWYAIHDEPSGDPVDCPRNCRSGARGSLVRFRVRADLSAAFSFR